MDQKSKSIGNTKYLVTQMDAISALEVQTKLIKMLGVGIVALMNSSDSPTEKIQKMIPKLMENFDDVFAKELILSLFERGVFIEVQGAPIKVEFSTHFAGKPMEMWKVVGFILETNFAMGESLGSILPTTGKAKKKKGN